MTVGYSIVGQRMIYPEDSMGSPASRKKAAWNVLPGKPEHRPSTSVRHLYTLELQGQITDSVLIPVNYFPQKWEQFAPL